MTQHSLTFPLCACQLLLLIYSPPFAGAGGQTSETFRVVADVFAQSPSVLAVGSATFQASLSIGQRSLSSPPSSGPGIVLASGYQATTEGFDTDYDGIPDSLSPDADGDGIPDESDPMPYDTDNDGLNNLTFDSDDDNDGLADAEEWLFGTALARRDTDTDGQDDYQEWIAGTRGNDAADFFHIASLSRDGTRVLITWNGVAGRRYLVLSTNDLRSSADWAQLWSTNVNTSGEVTYPYDAVPTPTFFKLRVSRQ